MKINLQGRDFEYGRRISLEQYRVHMLNLVLTSLILPASGKFASNCLYSCCANHTACPTRMVKLHARQMDRTFLMWFWPASSLICGNKMPTRCNRGFCCRSYCLLYMFRAPLFPSPGVVAACGISCCGFQVAGLVWSWGLCSILQTGHITLSSTPDQQLENHSTKYHRPQPLYNTLELLMMGIVVPGTCWESNKICNKNLCCI